MRERKHTDAERMGICYAGVFDVDVPKYCLAAVESDVLFEAACLEAGDAASEAYIQMGTDVSADEVGAAIDRLVDLGLLLSDIGDVGRRVYVYNGSVSGRLGHGW